MLTDDQKAARVRNILANVDLPEILVRSKTPMEKGNWIKIERANTKAVAWRCVEARHMTPQETQGKHNIYVSAQVEGNEIRDGSLSIVWGWDGQDPTEPAKPIRMDKKEPDYSDVPIFPGQKIWITIRDGAELPADIVRNLHGEMDGDGWNMHHHSYFIRFVLMRGEFAETPPAVQPAETEEPLMDEVLRRLAALEAIAHRHTDQTILR